MGNNFLGLTSKIARKVKDTLSRVEVTPIPIEENLVIEPVSMETKIELLNNQVEDDNKKTLRNQLHQIVMADQALIETNSLDLVIEMIECALHFEVLPVIYCEMATFLLNIGQPAAALKYYKLSLELDHTPATYSLYLQCLLMCPTIDEETLFNEAYLYNQFFKEIVPYNITADNLAPNKVLRIGYVCHFFHNSVSESLLLPFLREHNKQEVEVYCYSDTLEDEVPAHIEKVAHVWRNTKHLSDQALAQIIKEDKIDILLELNGHCVVNRYGVLAKKPAPIQINYYNQAGTTGMSTIDYILIGKHISLPEASINYSEKPYYLDGISGIAIFPDTFPAVSPVPSLTTDYITFGSFGAAHKVNQDVVKLWCKVLKAVPTARFYMKAGVLTHKPYLDAYQKLFTEEGIELERIQFEGMSDHITMLERYSQVDIALDTFPHAGGTTTMEAIWQGVPVISLTGKRYSSQNGKVVNTFIGHPELIAYTEDEFVQKAVELAQDKMRLQEYRATLRDAFSHSPLRDAKAHARRLETAYRDMWNQYLKSNQQ